MKGNNRFSLENKFNEMYTLNSRKYKFSAECTQEYYSWKSNLKLRLKELIGISDNEYCKLKLETIEIIEFNEYIRKKVVLETEKNVLMPMYILIPKDLKKGEKRPCVIAAHGHGVGGKYGTVGREDIPVVKESINKYNCDYGVKLVKEGYVVFCNDARGFGERRELMDEDNSKESLLKSSCNTLNNAAIALGKSLLGMMVWDLIRIVDLIQTLKYCDESNIGAVGFSGGGLQVLWLSALDERIKASFISGYFHSFKDSIIKTNFCGCNFVPKLWNIIEMGDLGALIAPRALLIESGMRDTVNGSRGLLDVKEQLITVKKAYKILAAENNIYHYVFNGGHIFNGKKLNEFFNVNLKK